MFYPMKFFVVLHSYGVLEQIQLCCSSGNFGQFFNLPKSKMNAGRHSDNFASKPIVIECNAIPLF